MIALAGTRCTELLAECSVISCHHTITAAMVSNVMTSELDSELFTGDRLNDKPSQRPVFRDV